MAEIVLFHHVRGLTSGVRAIAEAFAEDGHTVHTPDLFEGAQPSSLEEGMDLVRSIGDSELDARAEKAIEDLPPEIVYAGISLGVGSAQRFAQTRPGAKGALLYEACLPIISGEWAIGPWPAGVPVQIHGMEKDPFFGLEGDVGSAREIVDALGPQLAELFVYEGDQHLFTDSSLPSYDPEAARLALQRSRDFLNHLG